MHIRKEVFMGKNKIEILKSISETIGLWKKYNEVRRITKSYDCPKYELKVTVWNQYENRHETVKIPLTAEIPFSDDIDWTEYFEKTLKELESKLDSLSNTLNDDKDEEQLQLDLFDKLTKISALVNENDFVDFIKDADSICAYDAKDDGEDLFSINITSTSMNKSKMLFFNDKQSRDKTYQDLVEIQSAIGRWRK